MALPLSKKIDPGLAWGSSEFRIIPQSAFRSSGGHPTGPENRATQRTELKLRTMRGEYTERFASLAMPKSTESMNFSG
jgi:hypothetical protein